MDQSAHNYVKLSFKDGLESSFIHHLTEAVSTRCWERLNAMPSNPQTVVKKPTVPTIKPRTGIVGIERSLREQRKATDQSITLAFQDLTKLMDMAKDMVNIAKTISTKIRVRQVLSRGSYYVFLSFA